MKNEKKKSYIKKGDLVKIITGKNKGLIGKINSIFLKKSIVFIEGLSPRIRYLKRTSNAEATKVEIQIPIHISNVMLWDSKENCSSRIGYKLFEMKKVRFFKKSGNII